MQENIGYAVMTETPCVIINVQRAGPSTGQATRTADGDLMQAIWGCHGDARKPVLVATDAQDCYDLTVKAFNLSEEYRTPVILLTSETIAHTEEPIIIPRELRIFDRTTPSFGDGQRLTVTGSTHYLDGLRADSDPRAQQNLHNHFKEKIEKISRRPIVEINCDPENKVVVVSCGFTARSVAQAVCDLDLGNRVGTIVVKMIWPFPYDEIETAIPQAVNVLVPEMNCGQFFHLVREIHDRRKVFLLDQTNGMPIEPETIRQAIESRLKKVQQ
jgi:2-oxoglutarate ferredoxin oxidoreductase subunit alpha